MFVFLCFFWIYKGVYSEVFRFVNKFYVILDIFFLVFLFYDVLLSKIKLIWKLNNLLYKIVKEIF